MKRLSLLTPTLGLGALMSCAAPPASDDAWDCSSRVELSSVWTTLQERHDANGDGQITAEEYARGEVRFANYDRTGDGVLDASDFPSDTWFNGFNAMMVRNADADADQQVTTSEWQAFEAGLDPNGDGLCTPEEVTAVMGPWTEDWPLFLLSFDQDGDEDFDREDLAMAFRDQDYNGDGVLAGAELSGWQSTQQRRDGEPPAPGEMAPDFELDYAAFPGRSFKLRDASRTRPVALVFGSYT